MIKIPLLDSPIVKFSDDRERMIGRTGPAIGNDLVEGGVDYLPSYLSERKFTPSCNELI
jgi:hypothetical protein